ncbi:hypothetical protein FOM02_02475 [Bradyrhizobium sp. SEMIA]|nr:hypothetical protein FOM02_02475 [Bradyrhizobium sp. SEMIA]
MAKRRAGRKPALGIALMTEDFVKEAAMSDMLEIGRQDRVTKRRSRRKRVRDQMIADHAKIISEFIPMPRR